MKNSKLIIVAFTIVLGAISLKTKAANNGDVIPQEVNSAFTTKYPHAKAMKWKTTATGFEVAFKQDHKKCTAFYSADATLLKSELTVKYNNIPCAIKTAIRNGKFASFYINEVIEVITPENDEYVLTIDNHGGSTIASEGYGSWEDVQLVFNNTGTLYSVVEL